MRAVIIDDSRAMRLIIGRTLQGIGFEVVEAANGREGLERLAETPLPDVALVDWNMPELNGLDFVRAVRSDRAYDDVRLMMVTTETELAQMAAALQAGADEYVMKPFTREVLLEKLARLGMTDAARPTSAARAGRRS
jgi:two-component system chemotaxis response regulator CheY